MIKKKKTGLIMVLFAFVIAGIANASSLPTPAGQILKETRSFKLRIQNDTFIEYNNITGAGKNQSTLTDGLHYFDQLNVYTNGKVNDYTYNFNVGVKATDDSRKDIKNISLTSLKGYFSNKTHTLTAGDIYNSFSQYSLNTALKGASYNYEDNKQQNNIQLVYGIALPRWDSFWSDETKAIKRRVYAGKYTHNFSDKLATGFSMLTSDDSDRVYDGVQLYNNHLYTVDAKYRPITGLRLNGEYSYSNNIGQTSTFVPGVKHKGSAIKLQAIGDKNPSRVTLEYERINPEFITLTGSATPDREKAKMRWRYKYSREFYTNLGLLWFKDNLDGKKEETTNTYRPSLGITYKKLFGRPKSIMDINYKFDDILNSSQDTQNHFIDLSYQDTFADLNSITNIGYHKYDAEQSQKSKEIVFNTILNGNYRFDTYVLKPSIYLGTWGIDDELQNNNSQYYQAALGIGFDLPREKITSKLRIGKNKTTRDNTEDNEKYFGSFNIYWRAGNIFIMKHALIYTRAFVNDFRYSTATTANRDFQEQSVVIGIKNNF